MSTTKIIPLQDQPAYKEAISKVVNIGRALAATDERLEAAETELRVIQSQTPNEPGALDRAMAIINGGSPAGDRVPASLLAEVQALREERRTLKDGLVAANRAAEAVAEQLAREIGAKTRGKHKATVSRILECLEALCAANQEEENVRLELERLGYHRHGLQAQGLALIGQMDDWTGSAAYYFAKEAKQYIGK